MPTTTLPSQYSWSSSYHLCQAEQAIGVFDSGVGGLTVVRKLVNILPHERVIYLGDTARVPYGNKTASTVSKYAQECVQFLIERNVKLIIIACNTASALALDDIQRIAPVPVVGVIAPAAESALRHSRSGRIGIIGTRATIHSAAYQHALQQLSARYDRQQELCIIAEPCPLFVPFAEEGWHYHPATRLVAEEYLAPLKYASIDTLILGCTHYPLLTDVIQDVLPNVRLINSGEEAVTVASVILHDRNIHALQRSMNRTVECYITDKSTAFLNVAERFLGFPLSIVEEVHVGK
ncbi:MAG: glutamate racemase [Bacteroidota bacterium]|nr:glutamate racemase [Candidatus Kapabacteria bacterium]MDW8220621.1 glutamate racemase [Bacteroidota bacterium]